MSPPPPDTLDALQTAAVLDPAPVVVVMAPPGSGKTRVLTERVAHRIAQGASADRVLVATFTRAAALEVAERCGRRTGTRIACTTLHALAKRLLDARRSDAGRAPLRIATSGDDLVARAVRSALGPRSAGRLPEISTELAWCSSVGADPTAHPEPDVATVAVELDLLKRRAGVVDVGDLIGLTIDELEADPTWATAVRWRHRHLHLDEAQDLTPSQLRFVALLAGDDPDLFAVGDPDQAIYGWAGADTTVLVERRTPFEAASVHALEVNYRCAPAVLDTALVALGDHRQVPVVRTAADAAGDLFSSQVDPGQVTCAAHGTDDLEDAAVVAALTAPSDGTVAVLARTRARARSVADALAAAGVPVAPPDSVDASPDAVTVGTFHAAKGREWDTVHLVGLADGLVPHHSATLDHQIDEERRALYVALTRARTALHLSWSRHHAATPCPWVPNLAKVPVDDPPPAPQPPASGASTSASDSHRHLAAQQSRLAELRESLRRGREARFTRLPTRVS